MIYKRFNRRLFLALLFFFFASKEKYTADELNTTKCDWCWIGAVTNNSITIKAKLSNRVREGKNYIQVFYHIDRDLSANNMAIQKVKASSLNHKIATFNLVDLAEDTNYYYVIVADGRRYPQQGTLRFKTVKIHQPYSFAIACSSCAGGTIGRFVNYGVSNSRVFEAIRQYQYQDDRGQDSHLALFIHMGDLHYRNDLPSLGSKENHLDDYRDNYDLVMTQSRQKDLYQNIPLAYIWDDHDYGTNDSDGSYQLKYVASEGYREQVPHYSLEEKLDAISGKGAIYQSFIIGRVRFIMTDSRFYQDSIKTVDEQERQLLGSEQREWLLQQLKLGKQQQENNREGLTIWINSIPWIASADAPTDSWNKFTQERTLIADFIKENEIDKLLMISGDAHMLALDDGEAGTANSYATGGGGSFPVIQAASLDSRGSFKGDAYNGKKYIVDSTVKSKNGAIPGKGQWGLLNFNDNGNDIEVKVELKRMENTLIQHTFIFS
ncbi:MAG: alkaline phosphatase D family protein [Cyanobacteria bacterium J06631_6]